VEGSLVSFVVALFLIRALFWLISGGKGGFWGVPDVRCVRERSGSGLAKSVLWGAGGLVGMKLIKAFIGAGLLAFVFVIAVMVTLVRRRHPRRALPRGRTGWEVDD